MSNKLKMKLKQITRESLLMGTSEKSKPENINRLNDILGDLDTTRDKFIKKSWSRIYNYHLTYSKVFRRWSKIPEYKSMVKWFKKQPLYPTEVNNIVNIMWVLENKYGVDIYFDDMIKDAIFLNQMLIQDIYAKAMVMSNKKGLVGPKTITDQPIGITRRELKARGFIHINDFDNYDPEYNYIVIKSDDITYYYPVKGINPNLEEKHMKEGHLYIYILQSVIGLPIHTEIKHSKVKDILID